jgi:hypothetical protein
MIENKTTRDHCWTRLLDFSIADNLEFATTLIDLGQFEENSRFCSVGLIDKLNTAIYTCYKV